MKAALIPPRGYETTAGQSDFHLMLAQIDTPAYVQAYAAFQADGHYIVLDNGAAEGDAVSDVDLLYKAFKYRVDELVIPDVMGDYRQTRQRVNGFFRTYYQTRYDLSGVKFQAVVQGQTLEELYNCVNWYSHNGSISVLGIPRHLITTLKDVHVRRHLAWWINRNFPGRFQLHFLGTNPMVADEVYWVRAGDFDVRSVDSSLPFNYTAAHRALDLGEPFPGLKPVNRPDNYFGRVLDLDAGLLQRNINTFLEWSRGTEGTRRGL